MQALLYNAVYKIFLNYHGVLKTPFVGAKAQYLGERINQF